MTTSMSVGLIYFCLSVRVIFKLMKKIKEVIPKSIFKHAMRLAKKAILVALILTPIRFFLELAGIPEHVIFIIGLLWLTLGFSIYWGIQLFKEKHSYLILFFSLLIFSPISRFPVAILWWIDTRWKIGTHYSLYFDNFGQATFQQVVYGSLIQLIPGFLLGAITIMIMQNKKNITKNMNTIENE